MGKKIKEKKHHQIRNEEPASDVDEQLRAHFNNTYVGDIGLRSATGAALDRAAFGLGSTHFTLPDGFDDNVRLGVVGAGGRIEATKVSKALANLCGPPPPPYLPKGLPEKEVKRRIQEANRVAKEWRWYFPVLRGYYTKRDPGTFRGMGAFGEYAGVVLVVPRVESLVRSWCHSKMKDDLEVNSLIVSTSESDRLKKIEELEERTKGKKEKPKLVAKLEALRMNRKPDTEIAIRSKWTPNEGHIFSALREVGLGCNGPKDTPKRQQARVTLLELMHQAEKLWRAARRAYAVERKNVDRELRPKTRSQKEKEDLKNFSAPLGPMIPRDQD